MTIREVRNTVVRLLHEYLNRPVQLSDQASPEPQREDGSTDYPYIIYTATAPYISRNVLGDHSQREEGDRVVDVSREDVTATYSFTACSMNRDEDGDHIFGDDEALDLAERAIGWFRHVGCLSLSLAGVVVVEVMNVGNRTILEIDEVARRYGFDVQLRFTRMDEQTNPSIETPVIYQKKE